MLNILLIVFILHEFVQILLGQVFNSRRKIFDVEVAHPQRVFAHLLVEQLLQHFVVGHSAVVPPEQKLKPHIISNWVGDLSDISAVVRLSIFVFTSKNVRK